MLPRPSKLVIFDLDGTLVDSLQDIAAAMNHALSEHGLAPYSPDDYLPMVGAGAQKLAERAVGMGRSAVIESVVNSYYRYYADHPVVHTRLYPGIAELLTGLLQKDVALAVLSNKSDAATQAVVRKLLAPWKFEDVRGERPPAPLKPNPTAALEICGGLSVRPSEAIFIGDSGIDMKTAVAAEMLPVGVLWGFRNREELVDSGARILLETPEELLRYSETTGAVLVGK
jgi:phosphoglycolate phosphatase